MLHVHFPLSTARRLGWKRFFFSAQLHQGHCQSQGWIFYAGQIQGGHAPEIALLLQVLSQQKMSWWKKSGSGIAAFGFVVHVHGIFQLALASTSPGLNWTNTFLKFETCNLDHAWMTSTAMYWMLNFLWLKHATLKTQDVIKKQQVSVYLQATVMLSDLGQACLGMVKHSVYVTFTAQKNWFM